MVYKIYTDGGARGNPGPGAIGVVIYDEKNNLVARFGRVVGEVTNNQAEYLAVKEGLLWVKKQQKFYSSSEARSPSGSSRLTTSSSNNNTIHFYLDSLLVASQLGGVYKIKDSNLKNLFAEIELLISELQAEVSYTHIPRERNKLADEEVNKALDKVFFAP